MADTDAGEMQYRTKEKDAISRGDPTTTINETCRRIKMGKIVATEYVSLDGVVEALNSEALLLGRVTYEGFAAAWPSMEGEFADRFNAMPKYVVSSTLENPEWNNSTVLEGDVVEE